MSYLAHIAARNAPADASVLRPVQVGDAMPLQDPFTTPRNATPDPSDTKSTPRNVATIQPIPDALHSTEKETEIVNRPHGITPIQEPSAIPAKKDLPYTQVVLNRMKFADAELFTLLQKEKNPTANETIIAQQFPEREHATLIEHRTHENHTEEVQSTLLHTPGLLRPVEVQMPQGSDPVTLLQPQQKEQPGTPKIAASANAPEGQQQPKLTIGKITVEVVAPEKPARNMPQAAGIQIPPRPVSNWHKHRSGLGQF